MADIAVIGDNESTKGFAAVGLKIFPCENAEQAEAALNIPELIEKAIAETEFTYID